MSKRLIHNIESSGVYGCEVSVPVLALLGGAVRQSRVRVRVPAALPLLSLTPAMGYELKD